MLLLLDYWDVDFNSDHIAESHEEGTPLILIVRGRLFTFLLSVGNNLTLHTIAKSHLSG